MISCNSSEEEEPLSIIWEEDIPSGINISRSVLSIGKDQNDISVKVKGADNFMLGELVYEEDFIHFDPVVHLTQGLTYEVYLGGKRIGSILVEIRDTSVPSLVRIYPSADTVPLNLLKIYLEFSQPMMTGNSLDHISVIDRTLGDTVEGTFLDLQSELWNEDNTMLTLWLDPGRIKRELIPNRELGNPLEEDHSYSIIVSSNWKGANGLVTEESSEKSFYVTFRDSISTSIDNWQVSAPASDVDDPLVINFDESLDAVLARNVIRVLDEDQNNIEGSVWLGPLEKTLFFKPDESWALGNYFIEIESRLEDLAGNNLIRLFEEDIKKAGLSDPEVTYKLNFEIKSSGL